LTRVEGDVDEVKRERANRLTEMLEAEPFARTLRRLRTDFRAVALPSRRFVSSGARPSGGRYWRPAAGSLSDYLSASAASSARVPRTFPRALDKVTVTCRGSMDGLRESRAWSGLDIDDVERVFSLAFAVNQLSADLADLGDRIAEHAKPVDDQPGVTGGRFVSSYRCREAMRGNSVVLGLRVARLLGPTVAMAEPDQPDTLPRFGNLLSRSRQERRVSYHGIQLNAMCEWIAT